MPFVGIWKHGCPAFSTGRSSSSDARDNEDISLISSRQKMYLYIRSHSAIQEKTHRQSSDNQMPHLWLLTEMQIPSNAMAGLRL